MSILCKKEGILTTIQDLGRTGFRRLGINPGGVMDRTAARLLNILTGNIENEAVLEMHFPAGEYIFETGAVFAVGGADFQPTLEGRPVTNWKMEYAREGERLSFSTKSAGARVYLSVGGGFSCRKWLGSAATNLTASAGGFEGRRLKKGDRVEINQTAAEEPRLRPTISRSLIPPYSSFPMVRILPGAEFDLLTSESLQKLTEEAFTVTNDSNRTGYRIKGEALFLRKPVELVSSATGFGTIQLLPGGQMIILMADHQTTGGYPRVAHIITRDLPLAAQLGAGDRIAFVLVSVEDAEAEMIEFERDITLLKLGRSLAQI